MFAGLTGPTLNGVVPNGFAQYEIHSGRTELEVRVGQINLQGGTQLSVVVNGISVGIMTVDSGEARLRLRSDEGQFVPVIVAGSTIAVNFNGAAILTGTFTGFAGPSPSPSPSPSGSPSGSPSPSPSASPSPSFGRSFESHLTGIGTSATGEIKVTLNAIETQAIIFGEFHNLSSSQTGARIETMVGSTVTILNLGVVGSLNGNFAAVTISVSAIQVQQLRAGLWSAVITSVNKPAGEIRGTFVQQSNRSDFDGDGSSDFAVFRPSTGTWYSQNNSGVFIQNFGTANDRVVSGDYDGDGKTDAAVYRGVNGQGVWEIKRSSDAGVTTASFGLASDVAVRGDFDGDGRLDLSVYRPSDGTWYIQKSNNTGYLIRQFGVSTDKPMPADMDGDGKDDLVVFRAAQGTWYWMRSSDGQFAGLNWGQAGDVAVNGDFDGDGKGDVTVYRPSTGIWYTLRSSDGQFRATYFGLANDVPVAGNYDADGKTDIAVFRPSDGNWYVLRSTDGSFQTIHFGINGDVPVIVQ
ncbi:MAG: FG-GAP-like repeat-containing protein [Pyrinomonadaceae bacterium]